MQFLRNSPTPMRTPGEQALALETHQLYNKQEQIESDSQSFTVCVSFLCLYVGSKFRQESDSD